MCVCACVRTCVRACVRACELDRNVLNVIAGFCLIYNVILLYSSCVGINITTLAKNSIIHVFILLINVYEHRDCFHSFVLFIFPALAKLHDLFILFLRG